MWFHFFVSQAIKVISKGGKGVASNALVLVARGFFAK